MAQTGATLLFMDQVVAVGGAGSSSAMGGESDPHILDLVRAGVTEAYDVLYQRHLQIAQFVARREADNPSDAEDVVAEAFASIFQSLKDGKGPKEFFRSYLLTVVRRMAHDRNRKANRTQAASGDDVLDFPVLDDDPVVSDFESGIMASAFKSLPERWQAVLWHLDIEGLKPAAAAPFVGLTPNGVSSLAIRAREGLRQAYLQHHISRTVDEACGEFAGQLGKYARNALKRTSMQKVAVHLDSCSKCTALLMELNDIQGGMRAVLFPLLTGVTFSPAAAAAMGLGTTTAGSSAAAAGAANPGLRGTAMVKVTAGVVAALTLAGLVAWFLQSGADSTVQAGASPVTDTPAPSGSPNVTPGGGSTPAAVPPAEPRAEVPVAPQSPAVGVEEVPTEPRRAAVVDSGPVTWTTAPQPSVTPQPSAQRVDGTFESVQGSNPTERDLKVNFSLAGDGAARFAEAVFTLPEAATFVSGKTGMPPGWDCRASGAQQIRCTSDSLDPAQLSFTLVVTVPQNSERETLEYQFGGQGLVTKTFANTFH